MGRGVTPPHRAPPNHAPPPPCPASGSPRGALWDLGAGCEVEDAALEDGVAAGETLAPYPVPGDSAPSGSRHSGPDQGLSPPTPPRMPGSRYRTLALGTPPRLTPELGLLLRWSSGSPPGGQVVGARHRPRPGLFPGATVTLPPLPAEPSPAGLPGGGAADSARPGSGLLPGAEVPPAADHAPGPQ